ncbi:DUF4349 domain-containing protein [Paenibacillus sp. IHBB 10380]|uniref:DUF4349 domain-containing protein n=1 Tax=Paenibacillus sp. IHBB 10380 TaxID=1566358 RepID=UPI000696175E|nr:DUF4349 domain-containing protein [Paenibacillus sp. IHBB 10380]
MRRRGFNSYLIVFLACAMFIGGCGSSSNKNSAAKSSNGTEVISMVEAEKSMSEQKSDAETPSAVKQKQSSSNDMVMLDQSVVKGSEAPVSGEGFTGRDTADDINKKLIYTADIVMEVEDYGKSQSEIRNMVSLAGGYIVGFTENQSKEEQGGTFTLKVPATGFSPFLDKLEKLEHESLQRSINGQDVTEEYMDLEARLKTKVLMEVQYMEFMKKATKPTELVTFANELGQIQEEIEQTKGRMRYINNNVSYSTIEIRLYQPNVDNVANNTEKKAAPLLKRANDALKGAINIMSLVFQWVVVILFGLIPFLLVGGIIVLLVWLIRRITMRKRADRKNLIRNHNTVIDPVHDAEDVKHTVQDDSDDQDKS